MTGNLLESVERSFASLRMTRAARVLVPIIAVAAAVSGGCSLRKQLAPVTPSGGTGNGQLLTEDGLNAAADVVGYAKYCKQELGLTQDVLPPWDCLDGLEIPTTMEGQPLDATNYPKLTAHTAGCDIPSWLGSEPCANYGFVQKRQLSPDVSAYLLCRLRSFSTYKNKAARLADAQANLTTDTFNSLYAFDSLGMIWTNAKTGNTCYFDFVGKVYGGYVPSPDDETFATLDMLPSPKPPPEMQVSPAADAIWKKNGRTTWRSPQDVVTQDNCITCHDTGALKGSPWMMQVMNIPANDPTVPFVVVGKTFDPWRQNFPVRAISTAPITGSDGTQQPQICTTCHRIGSQQTCTSHMDFATGKSEPTKLSNLAATFHYNKWMPPTPPAWQGKSDSDLQTLWTQTYQAHVDRLKCCCTNPTGRNCTSQDITTSPLPAPVVGTGPAVCP